RTAACCVLRAAWPLGTHAARSTQHAAGMREGVVLGGTGGAWRVRADDGETVVASMRGRLKKSDEGRRADGSMRRDTVEAAERVLKLAVGDRVTLEPDAR